MNTKIGRTQKKFKNKRKKLRKSRKSKKGGANIPRFIDCNFNISGINNDFVKNNIINYIEQPLGFQFIEENPHNNMLVRIYKHHIDLKTILYVINGIFDQDDIELHRLHYRFNTTDDDCSINDSDWNLTLHEFISNARVRNQNININPLKFIVERIPQN